MVTSLFFIELYVAEKPVNLRDQGYEKSQSDRIYSVNLAFLCFS